MLTNHNSSIYDPQDPRLGRSIADNLLGRPLPQVQDFNGTGFEDCSLAHGLKYITEKKLNANWVPGIGHNKHFTMAFINPSKMQDLISGRPEAVQDNLDEYFQPLTRRNFVEKMQSVDKFVVPVSENEDTNVYKNLSMLNVLQGNDPLTTSDLLKYATEIKETPDPQMMAQKLEAKYNQMQSRLRPLSAIEIDNPIRNFTG